MQVSYFENGRYYAPSNLPRQWPMPAGAYDRDAGLRAFRGMVERSRYAEELGFDWVSVSEHHYSPRILTPPAGRVVSIGSYGDEHDKNVDMELGTFLDAEVDIGRDAGGRRNRCGASVQQPHRWVEVVSQPLVAARSSCRRLFEVAARPPCAEAGVSLSQQLACLM